MLKFKCKTPVPKGYGAHSSDIRKKNYSYFISPTSLSQYYQQLAICPHPEPNQSSPLFTPCFCKIHFNNILPLNPRCYTSSLSSDFPTKRSVTHACHMLNRTQHLKFVYTSKPHKKISELLCRPRLSLRRLMSYIYIYIYIYIYGAPILDVSRSHTTTQHSR